MTVSFVLIRSGTMRCQTTPSQTDLTFSLSDFEIDYECEIEVWKLSYFQKKRKSKCVY